MSSHGEFDVESLAFLSGDEVKDLKQQCENKQLWYIILICFRKLLIS